MIDDSFIWKSLAIESVDDILSFEQRYQNLVNSTPDEWVPVGDLMPHDFGDGSLCLMERGHFKMMAEDIVGNIDDVFIRCGCSQVESLVLHSFLGFESCIYRKDSYYRIPPIVNTLCQLLDGALDKLPHNEDNMLFRACVYEDRADFSIGELFKPGYSLTTSADETWRNKSDNRYIIKPLGAKDTRARTIYSIINKANEYQVSFLSTAKFIVKKIENWGDGKKAFFMDEVR